MSGDRSNGRVLADAPADPPVKVPRAQRWHLFHQGRIRAADGDARRQLSAVIGYLLSALRRASLEDAARVAREVGAHLLAVIEDLTRAKEGSGDDDGSGR